MSTHDKNNLDEFAHRDTAVSQRYRQLPNESVPAHLDHAILQQAQQAVRDDELAQHKSQQAKQQSKWQRYHKPLALAASLLIVSTVVFEVSQQTNHGVTELGEAPSAVLQRKSQGSLPEPSAKLDQLRVAPSSKSPQRETEVTVHLSNQAENAIMPEVHIASHEAAAAAPPINEAKPLVAMPVIQAPAPATEMAATNAPTQAAPNAATTVGRMARSDKQSQTVVDSISSEDIGRLAASDASLSTSTKSAASTDETKRDEAHAAASLAYIRELRKQGKTKQADEAWQQFRKSWPDYPVASDDVARSKSPQ